MLYFAQLLLASGEAEQAVAVLENSSVGPLTLVANQSPAAAAWRLYKKPTKQRCVLTYRSNLRHVNRPKK